MARSKTSADEINTKPGVSPKSTTYHRLIEGFGVNDLITTIVLNIIIIFLVIILFT